jgi:hypothetical protein
MCSFRLANVNSCKMEAMTTYAQGCQLLTDGAHPRLNAAAAAALGWRGGGFATDWARRDTHRSGLFHVGYRDSVSGDGPF